MEIKYKEKLTCKDCGRTHLDGYQIRIGDIVFDICDVCWNESL